jgi:VWFA-related protein
MRAAAVVAGLLLVPAPLAAQAVPTFTTSVEAVYVDVFVTRDGRPVPGLAAADFEVRDNGDKQDVTLASLEEVPIVAVLVFDTSGSVAGARLEHLRAGGRALLAGLRPQDEAALVVFSHELRVVVPQAGDRSAVERGLEGLHPEGDTALWDGLYAGLKVPVSRGRPMVVLFTDGQDNVSWLTSDQVHRVAEESEALVYVVAIDPMSEEASAAGGLGFGGGPAGHRTLSVLGVEARGAEAPGLRALRLLAEATGGRLVPAGSSAQLERTFLRILAEMRSRYLLSYSPGVVREGWHRLEVKVKGHRGTVRSRSRYFVAPRAAP